MLKISVLGVILFLFFGNKASANIDFDLSSENNLTYFSVNSPPEANEGLKSGFNLSVHIIKSFSLIPKINTQKLNNVSIINQSEFYSSISKFPVNTYLLFRQLLI